MSTLRIAILTHSTNPRGGVVHALALGEALTRLGHQAVVHAPDPTGQGFFRPTPCETMPFPAGPTAAGTVALVHHRIADYLRHFEPAQHRRFDIYHAQDSISGNALAALKAAGRIAGFARTVHHLDQFADARLTALQARAITAADRHFSVSRQGARELANRFGIAAAVVGNGVDTARFNPTPDASDTELTNRLALGPGHVFLAVGGVEPRKNTLAILQAFRQLRQRLAHAQLLIAGGASLLDHGAYQAEFDAALAASGLPAAAVIRTGPLPQAEMPALYRLADALVFPSLREGFGLAVLEAMASGLPAVIPRTPPFTEYLAPEDAAWCDPLDPASIADAMAATLDPAQRRSLVLNGAAAAERHDWMTTAQAHLPVYARLREAQHA